MINPTRFTAHLGLSILTNLEGDQEMNISKQGAYGPNVKVVCKPGPAPSCDLVVRVRDPKEATGWRDVASFNDMSDGYAHHNAHRAAQAARVRLLEGEVV